MSEPPAYHLLVVDDEEGPRQSIRLVFHKEYSVHLAHDADSALAIARTQPIDVAILDIRMAGMSGVELLEQLKQLDPAIEVIMLTAYETLETARQALRYGARDYLGKPFDVETLRQSVSTALMHRKISRKITLADQELQRLSGELEDAVAREDMTRTLNQVYAGVLHDINNPLTIIQCFVDLLLEQVQTQVKLEKGDLEHLRERLTTVSRQIQICSQIATRHIDFLRPPPADLSSTSVNRVLEDLREMMRVHPVVKRGNITVEPLPEDAPVKINTAELTQILLNLVLNSLQNASSDYSVTVKAEARTRPIDLEQLSDTETSRLLRADTFENEPTMVCISVADRAGGIAPELLEKIFEPYFTTRENDKGTGLGLYIVSRIVRSSHGALYLQTEPGKGTTFSVFLPAAK